MKNNLDFSAAREAARKAHETADAVNRQATATIAAAQNAADCIAKIRPTADMSMLDKKIAAAIRGTNQ